MDWNTAVTEEIEVMSWRKMGMEKGLEIAEEAHEPWMEKRADIMEAIDQLYPNNADHLFDLLNGGSPVAAEAWDEFANGYDDGIAEYVKVKLVKYN